MLTKNSLIHSPLSPLIFSVAIISIIVGANFVFAGPTQPAPNGNINPSIFGPAGPAGPLGDKGPIGAVGPPGDKGLTGAIGQSGDKGPTGFIGPYGDQGPRGILSSCTIKGSGCDPQALNGPLGCSCDVPDNGSCTVSAFVNFGQAWFDGECQSPDSRAVNLTTPGVSDSITCTCYDTARFPGGTCYARLMQCL